MKKVVIFMLVTSLLILAGCACSSETQMSDSDMSAAELSESEAPDLTEVLAESEESRKLAAEAEALRIHQLAENTIIRARALEQQYFYEEALELLNNPDICDEPQVREASEDIAKKKNSLVNYTGVIPHIFFHSLIVYPQMVFTDLTTPMGGYNSGFSEKAELEKILPQLYERGYVLYDLDSLYDRTEEGMIRREIRLPEGKTPLILSVDDVAYAYGAGYARQLFLDEAGNLMYAVPNPDGGEDFIPDGDVMGVVDAFVREHPDFSYQGHKGTIALTGFQGAFGYYPYTDDGQWELDEAVVSELKEVVNALKSEGWNFASHSYTHNGIGGYFCQGCNADRIQYDTQKWLRNVSQYVGETRLYIAPFGFRVPQPALQEILDAGFDIYCTVDDKVYNEVNEDYFLMSRIEISGYSMTYYSDLLNEMFFNVDDAFDRQGRPPVI